MRLFVVLLLIVAICCVGGYRPVVIMHGIGANLSSMDSVIQWIQADYPGIYIKNVEIGNGAPDSWFMPINSQVESFAATVTSDPNLKGGFNLIGYSQGGLITRAYVERYNYPPVHNLISWAGPQDGVFGVPEVNAICPDNLCPFFDWLLDILMHGESPSQLIQDHYSFAAYWKNPFDLKGYLANNVFLSDINNERDVKNNTYKKNIVSLNSYLLTYALLDEIVIPRVSPWFSFYAEGQDKVLVNITQSPQYQQDWIGLQTLDKAGKLLWGTAPCSHQNIPTESCKSFYTQYTSPLLNN